MKICNAWPNNPILEEQEWKTETGIRFQNFMKMFPSKHVHRDLIDESVWSCGGIIIEAHNPLDCPNLSIDRKGPWPCKECEETIKEVMP